MMTLQLRVWLIVGILFFLAMIVVMIRKNKLNLKYALIWLLTAFVLIIITAFPGIVNLIANALGIYSVVNSVFVFEGLFVLLIILSLTSIVSLQTNRIRNLTQEQAMLEKRLRDLENKL